MAYASGTRHSRRFDPRSLKLDFAPDDNDWRRTEAPPRDLRKLILVAGLGTLSWVATYIGMLELIQANMGDLPFTHKVVIGFSVAMLMIMIIWLLDQLFKPHSGFVKLCYIGGYLFLTVISVGFGFGFYWKVLESRTEASRSAESAVTQVQASLHGASTRLEQLQATLVQLSALSKQKAELERTQGTSCPNSRPGDGPRRRLRDADAARFSFASEFVAGRVGVIKGDMRALDGDLAKISGDARSIQDPKTGTRNEFMRALGRKLELAVTRFNAFRTDPQLKQLRTDLAGRADKTVFDDGNGGTFDCPDPQLQQSLHGSVRALDQLPVLEKPEIAVVEGSEATVEAFRRLTATMQGAVAFDLPPSAEELRELQEKAIQTAEGQKGAIPIEAAGLSKRDYIPLSIAIFVDLCLLLVSMGRSSNRLEGLVPKMIDAERGPVIEILSRFKDIHRDPQVRDNFELFRHVVFDQNGDYYVAVPLDAPYKPNPLSPYQNGYGTAEAQDLQHEAHLLANLFTSFEKERIFRRVYNPIMLHTAAIQRRLARQGSKFAACRAFRVYKFRDGAWSEIILGAVMGAARRAEAQRKRRELEEELFQVPEPSLSHSPQERAINGLGTSVGRGPGDSRQTEYSAAPESVRTHTTVSEPYIAKRAHTSRRPQHHGRVARQRLGDLLNALDIGSREREDHVSDTEVSAADVANFGPYASPAVAELRNGSSTWHDEDEVEETIVSVHAANSAEPPQALRSIAEDLETSAAINDDAQRSGDATSDRIDVVLTQDRAQVSLPASEAALPHGVAGLIRKAVASARTGRLSSAFVNGSSNSAGKDNDLIEELGQETLPPALSAEDAENSSSGENFETDQVSLEQPSDELSRLASRFASRRGS